MPREHRSESPTSPALNKSIALLRGLRGSCLYFAALMMLMRKYSVGRQRNPSRSRYTYDSKSSSFFALLPLAALDFASTPSTDQRWNRSAATPSTETFTTYGALASIAN